MNMKAKADRFITGFYANKSDNFSNIMKMKGNNKSGKDNYFWSWERF